jgi:hypothetical protein
MDVPDGYSPISMNTYQQFELRLEPREELRHLVQLASGLLANSGLTTYRHPGTTEPLQVRLNGSADLPGAILVATLATQVFEELRTRVEANVDEHPERYVTVSAGQFPTE